MPEAAAVVIVSEAIAEEEPFGVTEEGEIAHDTVEFEVEQRRLTVPLNPPTGATLMVVVADCPAEGIVMLLGFADTLKSERVTVTGVDAEAE